MKRLVFILLLTAVIGHSYGQKILFDATKSEFASNADWVIDADQRNLNSDWPVTTGGNESNPQQIPTPAQSGITSSTTETFWDGGISAWGVELVKYNSSYIIETLPYDGQITYGNSSNSQDLSNYDVFVLCEPNSLFSAAEKTAIMQFVQNGGGLFMISDHDIADRNGDGDDAVDALDDLITNNSVQNNAFGIIFDHTNISETPSTNAAPLPNDDPLLHGPFGDVGNLAFHNGATLTINPSDNSSVKAVFYRNSASNTGNTDIMMAYATFGNGRVVALGDSSPADDGTGDNNDNLYNGWYDGDNGKLIANATVWLAQNSTPSSNGCASDLFISEIDENGTDKYIEIANYTGATVSLSAYDIVIYYNGSSSVGATIDLDDNATIADGEVYVIADDGSYASSQINQTDNNISFNGNDVIALRKTGTNIDVFGTIGTSSYWYDDKTCIRNQNITSPTTNYNQNDWTFSSYSGNEPSNLGSHTINCGNNPQLTVTPASLDNFSYQENSGPSTSKTFSVEGTDLDGSNITVSAPNNYELSTDNTAFSQNITLSYSGQTLNNTTIYIRLKAGLPAGTYSGNATITGGGASEQNIILNGKVSQQQSCDNCPQIIKY